MLTLLYFFFFFNDTATTEIYTLSLHDALPICQRAAVGGGLALGASNQVFREPDSGSLCHMSRHIRPGADRKSTRLNSSHSQISYAVFCLKKKKITYAVVLYEES